MHQQFSLSPTMKKSLLFIIIVFSFSVQAQFTDKVWCFGDSALMDFNGGVPVPGISASNSSDSPASICDSAGNLLFYCVDRDAQLSNNGSSPYVGKVYSKNHQLMQNGSSLICSGYPYSVLILPDPGNSSRFYIFHQNSGLGTAQSGLYYSAVDLSFNNGLGKVTTKNSLISNMNTTDHFTAVKHANGRDWWVLFRWVNYPGSNDIFFSFLVSPSGFSSITSQHIGSLESVGQGRIIFNKGGDKMLFIGSHHLINILDFDRCTGVFTNANIISNELPVPTYSFIESGEFSEDGNLIYLCETDTANTVTYYLRQYNLNAPNILASKVTLDTLIGYVSTFAGFSDIKLAPDGKIYITSGPDCFGVCFPYPDSLHTPNTDYLSVINNPDSAGFACNYQRFGYYLGGQRTYQGLPNNPNYELGRLIGSPCDSLTALQENNKLSFSVYPNPANNQITFSSTTTNYSASQIVVYNLVGERICTAVIPAKTQHYIVSVLNWQPGLYIYKISNESSVSSGKFVVQR